MRIREVLKDTLALLSLREEDSISVFCAAVNRALDEIGQRFFKKATERIHHAPLSAAYAFYDERTVSRSAPLRISAEGIYAFALTAYGDGALSVLHNGEVIGEYEIVHDEPLMLAAKLSELCEDICGDLTLSFSTEKELYLSSLALYDTACEEVPFFSEYTLYPASRFAHRFLAFASDVTRAGASVSKRLCYLADDGVCLRYDARGVYEVSYYALPDRVDEDSLDKEVFLCEKAEALVAPLTAYYLALEDENPAAEQFLLRYEALLSAALSKSECVLDRYGW